MQTSRSRGQERLLLGKRHFFLNLGWQKINTRTTWNQLASGLTDDFAQLQGGIRRGLYRCPVRRLRVGQKTRLELSGQPGQTICESLQLSSATS